MTTTVLRGGWLHLPQGRLRADVVLREGTIRAVARSGEEVPGARELDVDGLEVLPGVVDLHAHSRTPGFEYKEDFETLSRAAAVGGITTYVDMPNVDPPTVTVEALREKQDLARRYSLMDWGHFASGSKPEHVGALAAAGATGFKIFMVGGGYPHDDRIAVTSNDRLYWSLEEIARTGLLCLVHPTDQSLFDFFSERAFAAGRPHDHHTRAEVYTGIDVVWRSAVSTLIELQKDTGARLHLLHTHAVGSLEAVRRAKEAGQAVTAAVDPKYFHLTRDDLERLGPRAYSGACITDDPERVALIWRSLQDGTIDVIDSDHGPHTLEEVDRARTDAWNAPLGNPQYDDMLSVMLTDVDAGLIDLSTLVRLLCENPARLLGRYPQKGAIAVGADADLVVVDLRAERVVRDEDVLSKAGWSPYRDRTLRGLPVLTIARGQVIAEGRNVVGEPGGARYLPGIPLRPGPTVPAVRGGLAMVPDRGTEA